MVLSTSDSPPSPPVNTNKLLVMTGSHGSCFYNIPKHWAKSTRMIWEEIQHNENIKNDYIEHAYVCADNMLKNILGWVVGAAMSPYALVAAINY